MTWAGSPPVVDDGRSREHGNLLYRRGPLAALRGDGDPEAVVDAWRDNGWNGAPSALKAGAAAAPGNRRRPRG